VTRACSRCRSELPPDAEPPAVEIQRADRPYASFYVALTSSTWTTPQVTDWADPKHAAELSTISGVQRVGIEGGRPLAMRVWIDPTKLAGREPLAGRRQAALQRNNYLAAVGQTKARSSR
jgi:multidrug efflux pump